MDGVHLDDGYIRGIIVPGLHSCPICMLHGHVIRIRQISLPDGLGWDATILKVKGRDEPIGSIGLECGCYARLHRQITHIREKTRKS